MGKKINRVCVVGGGVMGREIALNAATHGYQTTLTDQFTEALDKAKTWAESYLDGSIKRGKLTEEQRNQALAALTYSGSLEQAVADADLVIECIVEKVDAKRSLFADLNRLAPADALLVSNSSYLPSSRFADLVNNPGRVANLHYFNPAMRMELVEIVRGPHTSDDTIETLKLFAAGIGKTGIVVNKEIEGFIVNRILKAVTDEALYLLDNHVASVEDIDLGAEKGLNYPMGPFRLMDFTGLDISYLNRKRVYDETGLESDRPSPILEEKYKNGEFGRKTGKGWYDYSK